jgi:acetylornithine/N-succinyldiaminopimelate aminotransferase
MAAVKNSIDKVNLSEYFMPTYGIPSVTFTKGVNAELFDEKGKRYIDLLAGIAVVSVGHCNTAVTQAITEQAHKLSHISNYFYSEPNKELAKTLHTLAGDWGQVFFSNSGSEANECAIKLARKWGGPEKSTIISALNSFHGRTLGSLAATGQPAKWNGFQPLPGGFDYGTYNDLATFEKLVDEKTAAVIIEPIQGEGGIIPANREFLTGLRELCTARECLLIFDEIQSGVGRTGKWWAFQQYGVTPDIFTSAKALGNGFPIGACIAAEWVADSFKPGDHGSTFGGNPLASAASLATIRYIEENDLLSEAERKGTLLSALLADAPHVQEVRGAGLMKAVQLHSECAKDVTAKALEKGLVVNSVRPDTIRLVPPLTIEDSVLREGCEILKSILASVS